MRVGEVDVKIDDCGRLLAVKCGNSINGGKWLRVPGEVVKECSHREEDCCIVNLNCGILFDAEKARIEWFLN